MAWLLFQKQCLYLIRIPSETLNVLLDPSESHVLILEPHITGYDVIVQAHEAESSYSVVECHLEKKQDLLRPI